MNMATHQFSIGGQNKLFLLLIWPLIIYYTWPNFFNHIKKIYKQYNLIIEAKDHNQAFKELIIELSNTSTTLSTGTSTKLSNRTEKVVILIDEYDKPIIEYIEDVEKALRLEGLI